jgi:hypothetical protein
MYYFVHFAVPPSYLTYNIYHKFYNTISVLLGFWFGGKLILQYSTVYIQVLSSANHDRMKLQPCSTCLFCSLSMPLQR